MERCLWAIGFLALAAWFGVWLNARQQQAEGNRELDRRLEAPRETRRGLEAPRAPSFSPRARLPEGELIGRIEIPRLHVSTIVFEGTDDKVLSIGVGHLSGSALPGEPGNVVLAAHRDTFFRPLRSIHRDDRIVMVTPAGTRRYQVDLSEIVSPNYIEVLAPTMEPSLTLITCYPFEWFGHAPRRFIVRAHELEDSKPSRSPASAAKAQMRAEDAEAMASVDGPLPVDLHAKRAMLRTVALSQAEPAALHTGPVPHAAEIKPEPLDEPTSSVKKSGAVKASTAVQETTVAETSEPEFETDAPKGNRIIRGIRKLNPKRLLGRASGQ